MPRGPDNAIGLRHLSGRVRAFLVVLVVAVAGCASPGPGSSSPPPAQGAVGPDWSFTDTDGANHSRASAAGEPAVLFFMATWCGSCRANAPRVAAVHEAFADEGLQVFSVGWDPLETAQELEDWKERYHQPWPHGTDPGAKVARAFGIKAQSSLVVVDAAGNPVRTWGYGGASEADLRAAVEEAFARST